TINKIVSFLGLLKKKRDLDSDQPQLATVDVEVQRIRKDSEIISPPISAISEVRRESNQFRAEILTDGGRSIHEKTKIYRLPQSFPTNITGGVDSVPGENNSLVLAA
ncbi:unnamed protein product, partial [Didymodactylos carnosus]